MILGRIKTSRKSPGIGTFDCSSHIYEVFLERRSKRTYAGAPAKCSFAFIYT
jgi:hypothetical protein